MIIPGDKSENDSFLDRGYCALAVYETTIPTEAVTASKRPRYTIRNGHKHDIIFMEDIIMRITVKKKSESTLAHVALVAAAVGAAAATAVLAADKALKTEKGQVAVATAKAKATDAKEKAQAKATEVKAKVQDKATEVKSKVQDTATEVKSKVQDKATKVKEKFAKTPIAPAAEEAKEEADSSFGDAPVENTAQETVSAE